MIAAQGLTGSRLLRHILSIPAAACLVLVLVLVGCSSGGEDHSNAQDESGSPSCGRLETGDLEELVDVRFRRVGGPVAGGGEHCMFWTTDRGTIHLLVSITPGSAAEAVTASLEAFSDREPHVEEAPLVGRAAWWLSVEGDPQGLIAQVGSQVVDVRILGRVPEPEARAWTEHVLRLLERSPER